MRVQPVNLMALCVPIPFKSTGISQAAFHRSLQKQPLPEAIREIGRSVAFGVELHQPDHELMGRQAEAKTTCWLDLQRQGAGADQQGSLHHLPLKPKVMAGRPRQRPNPVDMTTGPQLQGPTQLAFHTATAAVGRIQRHLGIDRRGEQGFRQSHKACPKLE